MKTVEDFKHFVFVYGSLKIGEANHEILRHSLIVMKTHTTELFDLFCYSPSFPAMCDIPVSRVGGELYNVTTETMAQLDRLESNGIFYERRLISVQEFPEKVWAYFILPDNIPDILNKSSMYISNCGNISSWSGRTSDERY